ncbi:hypothetical protein THRCLA_23062, partial [Thraustotheca clavata]
MEKIRNGGQILTVLHISSYIKLRQTDWLNSYITDREAHGLRDHGTSLQKLCNNFVASNGYTWRKLKYSKFTVEQLERKKLPFAQNPSAVSETEKHSLLMTAVLTVSHDGKNVTVEFTVQSIFSGTIESSEIESYPEGHVYAVQHNGWMGRPHFAANSVILQLCNVGVTVRPLCPTCALHACMSAVGRWRYGAKLMADGLRNFLSTESGRNYVWNDISEETFRKSFEKAIPVW